MSADLFGRPAMLFLPASNPRAIEKARESDADIVVLDLEDAVKPEDKDRAREAAMEAVALDWPMPVMVRINGVGTEPHGDDLAAVLHLDRNHVVLPYVRSAEEMHGVARVIGHPVVAMIESAEGVMSARSIAREATALIVGTNDLSADLRLPQGAGRAPLMTALQTALLAGRAEGKPVFDGVFNRLDDADGFVLEAKESHTLGFDGKSLIHPSQIAPCRKAFAPSDEDVERAKRLIAAATGGAERFEGQMIEAMHVEAARRILNRR